MLGMLLMALEELQAGFQQRLQLRVLRGRDQQRFQRGRSREKVPGDCAGGMPAAWRFSAAKIIFQKTAEPYPTRRIMMMSKEVQKTAKDKKTPPALLTGAGGVLFSAGISRPVQFIPTSR